MPSSDPAPPPSLACLRHSFFSLYFLTLAHVAVELGVLLWQIDTLIDGRVQHFWGNSLWAVGWLRAVAVATAGGVMGWLVVLWYSLTVFDLASLEARVQLVRGMMRYATVRTVVTVATALCAVLGTVRGTPVYDVMMGTVWYGAASVVTVACVLVVGTCIYGAGCHRGRVTQLPLQAPYTEEASAADDDDDGGDGGDGCTTPPPLQSPYSWTFRTPRLSGVV